jgi:translation initiation factor 2-alpha kinase 4
MNRFTVYPRPRTARRDQPAFKVKSILKGTEYEGKPWTHCNISSLFCGVSVSRQELVSHLHQQIAEQKRVDMSISGTSIQSDVHISQNVIPNKDVAGSSDIQLVLPGDTKKQRKQVKQIFVDKGDPFFFSEVIDVYLIAT